MKFSDKRERERERVRKRRRGERDNNWEKNIKGVWEYQNNMDKRAGINPKRAGQI